MVNFHELSIFVGAVTKGVYKGVNDTSKPSVHPMEVVNFLKTTANEEVIAEMESSSVTMFHGAVPAKSLLYVPPGHILVERCLGSVVWGVQWSICPAISQSLLEPYLPSRHSELYSVHSVLPKRFAT